MQNTKINPGRALALEACSGPAPLRPQKLKEATQEFETQFVSMLMQSMRRTVPKGALTGRSEGLFREMLDQEWARSSAVAGGLGIGEMLYNQLAADSDQG